MRQHNKEKTIGMLLFLGTFGLNLASTWVRERYREVY